MEPGRCCTLWLVHQAIFPLLLSSALSILNFWGGGLKLVKPSYSRLTGDWPGMQTGRLRRTDATWPSRGQRGRQPQAGMETGTVVVQLLSPSIKQKAGHRQQSWTFEQDQDFAMSTRL
ncbi:hypothetical protein ElyMa_003231300 [Elysia marginata]|uniref:Uncharacterized protein n=1 Tax=Elysia marginata TaxID=1093978 RepID=A0AAV4J840_9GAST|nr:hypothetical protein ElyMa_003231300 [Elysia marginata]